MSAFEKKQQEMDRLIAKHYVHDPGATERKVAVEVAKEHPGPGWSTDTVEKRIQELFSQKILAKRTDIVDWNAVDYRFAYRVDVHLDVEALREAPDYGAPKDERPHEPVDNWRRLARYIMKDLIPFWERIPVAKTVSGTKFHNDDVILQNVTLLLGQQADLTVTLRARNQDAVLSFVVDGLRAMRGVKMTNTSHEAWSVNEGRN